MPQHLRILIIDDNPAIHRDFIKVLSVEEPSVRSVLEKYEKKLFGQKKNKAPVFPHFYIDTALQGQDGVKKITKAIQEKNPYSLAFVDIRMPPGWDGVETIKRIWQIDPDIEIVICTAYSDYTWEETVRQLGQRENLLILKKPFDHMAVRQLTCALTKKWQLLQETRQYTSSLEASIKERTYLLQQSLSVTRGTLESSADSILVIDKNNRIIDYNNKFIEMWKISPELLATKDGDSVLESIAPYIKKPKKFLQKIKNLAGGIENGVMNYMRDKANHIFEYYGQPYKLNGEVAGSIWSFRDITERALLEEKIQYQATHDALTALPNRLLLNNRIEQAITLSKQQHVSFAILFFDVDRFKLINDSFSHMIGDYLLQQVVQRIQRIIRSSDTLARFGGDEFVAVLMSIPNINALQRTAKKILASFEKPFKLIEHEIYISFSIGISLYPQDGQDTQELLRNADIAMYKAKELGGNQVKFYSADLGQKSLHHLEMEIDLRKAIINNEFFIQYQPQVELVNNHLISAEALIRWQHPTKGIILPIDFIPLAEETGLILQIGEWTLRSVCKQNKFWQDQGLNPIRISVNVGSIQLKHPNFVKIIKNILDDTGLKAKYLELELTENIIIDEVDAPIIISQLRHLGVQIALDDFGTGYSSISYLRKVHVDRLKIDQSYIKNINLNTSDEIIIKAIISIAKSMNLEIIAEGVETKTQLEFLKLNKCQKIQGYYFSKPLSTQDFEIFLKSTPGISKWSGI